MSVRRRSIEEADGSGEEQEEEDTEEEDTEEETTKAASSSEDISTDEEEEFRKKGYLDFETAKKYGIELDDELGQVKAEWCMAGEVLEDFTRRGYRRKIKEQEKQDFILSFLKGETDYDEKLRLFDEADKRNRILQRYAGMAIDAVGAGTRDFKSRSEGMYRNYLEPKFAKRHRREKRNLKKIEDHEREAREVGVARMAMRRGQKGDVKALRDKERAILLEIDHMGATDELKKALHDLAEKRKKEAELDGFRDRRKKNFEERVSKKKAESDALEADEQETLKERRTWRLAHYRRVEVEARAEAKERAGDRDGDFEDRDAELAAREARKKMDLAEDKKVDQTKGPVMSGETVFGSGGVLLGPEEGGVLRFVNDLLLEEGNADTEMVSGADHSRVKLFSTQPSTSHEEEWEALGAVEAVRDRALASARSCSERIERLKSDAGTLRTRFGSLKVQQAQLEAEHLVLLKRVAGPPRREASDAERAMTYKRQQRSLEMLRQMRLVERDANNALFEAGEAERDLALHNASAAAINERCGRERVKLEATLVPAVDHPNAQLPIVIGHALDDPLNGLKLSPMEALPAEAFKATTLKTKLELARFEAHEALKLRKQSRDLARAHRTAVIEEASGKDHLNSMMSRLADVGRRLEKARSQNERSELMNAIQLWWARGEKLNPLDELRHDGPLNWWANRDKEEHACFVNNEGISVQKKLLKVNVDQWRSSDMDEGALTMLPSEEEPRLQGVAHGTSRTAIMTGSILLPREDLYTIELVVTKRGERLGDSTDSCTVRLGKHPRHLATVATVHNVIDDYSGSARFEISHALRCHRLCYAFEFMSSSESPETHFAVEQGAFQPKTPVALEETPGTNRVVSSLVKAQRVHKFQGNRDADWLAELIDAEDALKKKQQGDDGTWDSDIVHGVPQRYDHDRFCGMLRNKLRKRQEELDKSPAVAAANVEKKAKRLEKSKLRYLNRKRESEEPRIEEALKAEGKSLEVFNEATQKWEHNNILKAQIKWYDNGTRCTITHLIVSVDDVGRQTAPARTVDMQQIRSFVAQPRVVDPAALRHWEANEAAEAAEGAMKFLHELEVERKRKLRAKREEDSEARFGRVRSDALSRKAEMSYTEAQLLLETRAVKFLTAAIAKQVRQEIKAGLLSASQLSLVRPTTANELLTRVKPQTHLRSSVVTVIKVIKAGVSEKAKARHASLVQANVRRTTLLMFKKRGEQQRPPLVQKRLTEFGQFVEDVRPRPRSELGPLLLTIKPRDLLTAAQNSVPMTPSQIRRKLRNKKLQAACQAEAEERWIRGFVRAKVQDEEKQWAFVDSQHRLELEISRRNEELAFAKTAKDEEKKTKLRELASVEETARLAEERRKGITFNIGPIPGFFEKCVPKARNCEHSRAKAWGDRYGKGVRCKDCGKELTMTHEDPLQQKGIGSGDDPAFVKRIARHVFNRAAYRAETADFAAEVAEIEMERSTLEKELWSIRNSEPHFYDFDDVKRVYAMDRRHEVYLRKHGVLRQGVHWSEEQLEKRAGEIKSSLDAKGFLMAAKPLKSRVDFSRRKAAYLDLLGTAGRVNNFRQRLTELRTQRSEIKFELGGLEDSLVLLHREVLFGNEVHLDQVQRDLTNVVRVMQIARMAKRQMEDARAVAFLAMQDWRKGEIGLVGRAEAALEAEDEAAELCLTTKDLLRMRVQKERDLAAFAERAEDSRSAAEEASTKLKEAQLVASSMHYKRRGVLVPTPLFGHCRVLAYRAEDEMIVCEMKFGEPKARGYFLLDSVMQAERAVAFANRVAMEFADNETRSFYKDERAGIKKEARLMLEDETSLKEKLVFDADQKERQELVKSQVTTAVANARLFVSTSKGRRETLARAAREVAKEIRRREIMARTWKGVGKRPKVKMTRWQRLFYKLDTFRTMRKSFVIDRAANAEREALAIIEQRQKMRASTEAVSFVFSGFLDGFLKEMAVDAIKSGLEAKSRTEDETGIVFAKPRHMQHGVYAVLSRWWTAKLRDLKRQLELLGAHSAQDELRREEERSKRAALLRDLELKERREKERQRRVGLARLLRAEELRSRRLYREQVVQCLGERRAMATAEAEMRDYLRQLIEFPVDDGKKVKKASTKEKRRLQIKEQRVENVRRKREVDLMTIEDAISEQERERERDRARIEALAKLKAEMKMNQWDPDADDDFSSDDDSGFSDEEEEEEDATLDLEQLREKRRLRRASKRRARRAARNQLKRDAFEQGLQADYEAANRSAMIAQAQAELAWMELEEAARVVEKEWRVALGNVAKVRLYCQRKGQEELRARSKARELRRVCEERQRERDETFQWHEECAAEAKRCGKIAKRIEEDAEFCDTKSLSATSYERLRTPALHRELHTHYFKTLIGILCTRAELIATERRAMLLQQIWRVNVRETKKRDVALRTLWRKRERDDLLRLRRSELGKRVLGGMQREQMRPCFLAWTRFWTWHRGHTQAFQLKHALIKHDLDLQRTHPKLSGSTAVIKKEHPKTRLQMLQARRVDCARCGVAYTEARNHAEACAFHGGGEFKLSCPRGCPSFFDPRLVLTTCMSHRTRRWTCCDSRTEKAGGCQRTFHKPAATEGIYTPVAVRLTEDLQGRIGTVEEEIAKLKAQDVTVEVKRIKQDQLGKISVKLDKEREVVKQYKILKCDKHIDDTTIREIYESYHSRHLDEHRKRLVRLKSLPSLLPAISHEESKRYPDVDNASPPRMLSSSSASSLSMKKQPPD